MAADYEIGMRYRIHLNDAILEGTFDGYNDGPDSSRYCRWANVVLLTPLKDTPPGVAQHVPRSDTHNATVT